MSPSETKKPLPGLAGNEELQSRLCAGISSGKIGHAYVIAGPSGSGKKTLARSLAAACLCSGGGEKPCGLCRQCRKVREDIHPDVVYMGAGGGKYVTVDEIRALKKDIYIAPNDAEKKVYIVDNAHNMTIQAQNALLKVLEEPPEHGVILLLAEVTSTLLDTVLSRAVTLKLSPVSCEEGAAVIRERMPEVPAEDALSAMRAAKGYIGAALRLLSGESKDKIALLREDYCKHLCGRSETALLQLHGKIGANREILTGFADAMYHLARELVLKKAAGVRDDGSNPLYRDMTMKKALLLMDIFRETKNRADANGNASLCAFKLLAASWEVTR